MKKIYGMLLTCICMLLLAACGQESAETENLYQVYYVSNSETKVEMHEHEMQAVTEEEKLKELIECLSTSPEKLEYKAPLAMGFQVLGAKLEEGLLFGTVSEEFSFMTVAPEPEAGYAAYFADNDAYRKLFAVLSRPNCLELLEFLYSEKEHYIMAEAAAARLGLPGEEVEALFREMWGIHLLHRLEMELASGMIDTYIVNENFAFVPFLLMGRCLIEKDMAFYVQWITRKSPLLRRPAEEKKKEKRE